MTTYDDGLPVSDSEYGYYTGGGVTVATNIAYPHPVALSGAFTDVVGLIDQRER